MNIRVEQERREHEYLSRYASFSDESLGRDRPEEQCEMRTIYQRDRDRILHCKAFRRLKHKTQVFLAPTGDHYRTRLTHTLEVSQIARSISRALRLNEDLTEAIALGHDLGHTPFGHAGERTLNEICPLGFSHYKQSIRVVELLEKDGKGLNLTKEVRDGIVNHRTSGNPSTLEGKVVRLSDKIAYINHDIDDAIRAKIFSEDDIPKIYTSILGNSTKTRLNTMINDIVLNSMDNYRDTKFGHGEYTNGDYLIHLLDNVDADKLDEFLSHVNKDGSQEFDEFLMSQLEQNDYINTVVDSLIAEKNESMGVSSGRN